MRVGIDARTLQKTEDLRGIGVLVSHLVQHLRAQGVDLVLFYSQRPDRDPGGRYVVLRFLSDRLRRRLSGGRVSFTLATRARPVLGILWEQVLVPLAVTRERLDVYHAPANTGVPVLGRSVFVATVNDVIPLVTPYFFDSRPDPRLTTWLYRAVHWFSVAIATWKARRIITLSRSSLRDIERLFPWARGKVCVIYPGADPRYQRVDDADTLRRITAHYGLPPRFLIYVGGLGQRKNLHGLLRAYASVVRRRPDVPSLAVVGKPNAFFEPLRRTAEDLGIAGRVRFTGFAATEDMPVLLSAAEMLVYPSFYEGFGLPVVEAMACGCPVICSANSSLLEVGGDAVLYCDPARPEDIAAKIDTLLGDDALRTELSRRGLRRAREFSMTSMAAQTLRTYLDAIAE